MNPFRNTLWLSLGDVIAKTLNFLAIVYLARTLGVAGYGELEFAITIITYFALLADGGLEIWSTRETARGVDIPHLVANTTTLRLVLSSLALVIIILLLPIFPDYTNLQPVLILLGLTLVIQALNPKWVFLGQEKMRLLAVGLVLAQIFFAGGMILLINSPEQIIWVSVIWLISEVISTIYFVSIYYSFYWNGFVFPKLPEMHGALKPAITIGLMQALGIMNYNFDSLLLGFLAGVEPVGWYRAGYKPITAALGVPLTYFAGLLPAFTREASHSRDRFLELIQRAFRLTVILALPLGFGGIFIARPIILLLYREEYVQSILVMQILSWSAVIVLIRATLRHGLLAVGRQDLALRSALIAVSLNIVLNLILIPTYGMIGAALTTVFSDLVWLMLVIFDFSRVIERLHWVSFFIRPTLAGIAMTGVLYLSRNLLWPYQLIFAGMTYFCVLALVGEKEALSIFHLVKQKIT